MITTIFGIQIDKFLKVFGKKIIKLHVVKIVFTFGKVGALERFTICGVESLCYDTAVLANSDKENNKYKRKNPNLEACVPL